MNPSHDEASSAVSQFSAVQARVLACLMEKQLTTPNNYPLSMNSLLLACNQKTNRVPVMNLTEGELGHAVSELEKERYVGVDYGGRATHVTHRVMTVFDIDRQQQAILAVLMVREPLTLNDIKTKTARMADFADITAVEDVLDALIARPDALVIKIPKGPGSRQDRYTHLLCGEVDIEAMASQTPATRETKTSRLDELEARLAAVEAKLDQLTQD